MIVCGYDGPNITPLIIAGLDNSHHPTIRLLLVSSQLFIHYPYLATYLGTGPDHPILSICVRPSSNFVPAFVNETPF